MQQLPVVDMLITKSDMEYQETMNYWKQIPQLMKYFRSEEDPRSQVPKDFMTGFLEVCARDEGWVRCFADGESRVATRWKTNRSRLDDMVVFTGGGLVRAVEIVICLLERRCVSAMFSSSSFYPPNTIGWNPLPPKKKKKSATQEEEKSHRSPSTAVVPLYPSVLAKPSLAAVNFS